MINLGAGTAKALAIESGEPKIVENNQSLLVRFAIQGSEIYGQPAEPTLLAKFGDIAPSGIGIGQWTMTVSLTGQFSSFTSSFSHADALGGR